MSNLVRRRDVLALGAAYSIAVPGSSWAQTGFPEQPIKMVVPLPAGSSQDTVGRVFASALSTELKQTIIVENRAGATGHIGGEYVARAAPDGYTLALVASSSQAASPHMMKLNYKPMEDLTPISLVAMADIVVVATKTLPAESIRELVDYAKANPGKLSYGSYGIGGNQHLGGQMLCSMAGIQMVHIPYSNNQLLGDLINGRIQIFVTPFVAVESHIQAGTLKMLGVASQTRLAQLPQIPTVAEAIPGFVVNGWSMLMAPAKTSRDIIEKLNAVSTAAVSRDSVKEALKKLRLTPGNLTVAETREFMNNEFARWGKVIREAGITAQS